MSINFLSLFQDTWNFVRNRPNFVFYAVCCLTALQLAIAQVFPRPSLNLSQVDSPETMNVIAHMLVPSLLSLLVVVWVNVLVILNIKSINRGENAPFFHHLGASFQRFLGVVCLSFVQFLPLSFGVSFFFLLASDQAGLIAIPLLITGLYVFIKLNLVIYIYLVDEPSRTLGNTLKQCWIMSRGKMLPLILFCALIYIIPLLLSGVVNAIHLALGGAVGEIIAQLLGALINLLMTLFSFRFYQVYRDYRGA